jgi:hypothetical protein
MKRNQFKIWLLLLSIGAIFAACEGPEGAAGLNGTDGTDGSDGADGASGNATCMSCHSTETKSNIEAQFAISVHSSGENAVDYAGARQDCAECHSHQGFVQFANTGSISGAISSPKAWECGTCHGLHETMEAGDYALRLTDPLLAVADKNESTTEMMDLGVNNNLCANCHRIRTADPNTVNPGETDFEITSPYYGPHHGSQANVLAGYGFAEIEGPADYPEAGSAKHLEEASCTGCHMGEFFEGTPGTYSTPGTKPMGGHSWNPSLHACNTCHEANSTDFNYGSVRTDVEGRLETLKTQLITLNIMSGDDEHGYHPIPGIYPMKQASAFFNWTGLNDDRSLGAHNPKYVRALLINSIS